MALQHFSAALLCAVLWAGAMLPARAAPVPEAERIPVDIRRTTLVVRDIDKSLPLYRDALGLKVIYDEQLGAGVDADGNAVLHLDRYRTVPLPAPIPADVGDVLHSAFRD